MNIIIVLTTTSLLFLINLAICYSVARTVRIYGNLFTIQTSIKAVGLTLPITTIVACAVALIISGSDSPPESPFYNLTPKGALAVIIPLAMGIHVASAFVGEDEPALEVLLTFMRPFPWVVLERVYSLILFYAVVGLITTVWGNQIQYEGPLLNTTISWFGPAIVLSGIGLRVTVAMRHIVFGITLVLGFWGVMGFFTYLLSEVIPDFWPVFLYPPNGLLSESQYVINRLILMLFGNALIYWAALILSNRELLLTGRRTQS